MHLTQRARPAVEAKNLVRERDRLVALEVCDLAAAIARSGRYVFGPKLLVEPALQRRDLGRGEAAHDAFFEWVRDIAAMVLVAGSTRMSVNTTRLAVSQVMVVHNLRRHRRGVTTSCASVAARGEVGAWWLRMTRLGRKERVGALTAKRHHVVWGLRQTLNT